MLKQRLISSFSLWSLLLAILCLLKTNGVVLLTACFSVLAQYELSKLVKAGRQQTLFDIIFTCIFIFSYYICSFHCYCTSDILYALALIVISTWSIFVGKTARSFFLSLFDFWYITFNLHFFLKILDLYQWDYTVSLTCLIWIILVTKMTDVGGFVFGCTLGKHLLAPMVSPKKTWEGVFGGIALALMGNIAYYVLFTKYFGDSFTFFKSLVFTIIISWCAIISDLLESLIKRQLQTKDSGKIIPGIGGVLDLVDSLLISAPVAYVLFKNFG